MTATEEYIQKLTSLKAGELGLIRAQSGQGLHSSVEAFDLFTGLWWPLRERSAQAPRRDTAWLIAKLYARSPLPHKPGGRLPVLLRRCEPTDPKKRERFQRNVDDLLLANENELEHHMKWALKELAEANVSIDWVMLVDDLSIWHRASTRQQWTSLYLAETEKG